MTPATTPRCGCADHDHRHLALETAGFSVIHRPPSALRYPDRFAREIMAWLAARRTALA